MRADRNRSLCSIEAEANVHVTKQFDLGGTFNWAHTKLLYTQCSDCAAENGILDPYGNEMERYPEFSGTASATYTVPVLGTWSAFGRSDFVYTGKQYATEANVAHIGSAARVNLRAGLSNATYSFEVFAMNALDNKRPVNIIRESNPSTNVNQSANIFVVTPPDRATIGVKGSIRF